MQKANAAEPDKQPKTTKFIKVMKLLPIQRKEQPDITSRGIIQIQGRDVYKILVWREVNGPVIWQVKRHDSSTNIRAPFYTRNCKSFAQAEEQINHTLSLMEDLSDLRVKIEKDK